MVENGWDRALTIRSRCPAVASSPPCATPRTTGRSAHISKWTHRFRRTLPSEGRAKSSVLIEGAEKSEGNQVIGETRRKQQNRI
jgi:hypothetical protein